MMISEMRVLVVDDEESMRDACQQILEHIGFVQKNITVIEDGREAQGPLTRFVFRLVLSDYNYKTPPFDGLELLKRIRAGHYLEENTGVPFILMTAEPYNVVEEVLKRLPPSTYIQKPFGLKQFTSKVREILGI